jgi:guanylate kinase
MSCWTHYDFVVVNDDLDRAGDDLRSIVLASRCSRANNEARMLKILDTFGGS